MTDITQNIKEDIEGKPVDWYGDVFDILFPNVDAKRANTLWKSALKKSSKERKESRRREREEEEDSDDD